MACVIPWVLWAFAINILNRHSNLETLNPHTLRETPTHGIAFTVQEHKSAAPVEASGVGQYLSHCRKL